MRFRISWLAGWIAAVVVSVIALSTLQAQGDPPPQNGKGQKGQGQKGDNPPGKDPDAPSPGRTPADDVGRRGAPLPGTSLIDDRFLPEAERTQWRQWFARNYYRFEPPPLAIGMARTALRARFDDAATRSTKRDLYVADVQTRLSLLLHDGDDRVRGAAAISLGRAGLLDDAVEVTRLFGLVGDNQKRVREQALLAAGLDSGSAAYHQLLRIAKAEVEAINAPSDSERARIRALATLFLTLRGEPPIPALVRDLTFDQHTPIQLRALVLQALGLSGSSQALEALSVVVNDRAESSLVRTAATSALGLLHQSAAVPLLLQLLELRDHDTDVRAAAAVAIGEVGATGDEELVRKLVHAYEHEANAMVERMLLLSLGRIGGSAAQLRLERVMEREGPEQGVFAELGLGLLARRSPSPQVIAPLLDSLRRVRAQDELCALLAALGIANEPSAVAAITPFAADGSSPDVRRSAIDALALLGQSSSVAVLERLLLDDPSPEVRMSAARALARLDPTCVGTLIHELGGGRTRSGIERAALILGLGFTRDPTAIESLLDLLRENGHTSREREAATLALGLIYDTRSSPPTALLGEARSFSRESAEFPALLALAE